MNDLGKLRYTLKETCPHCGAHLQCRTKGTVNLGTRYFSKDEIVCPNCDFSLVLQPEKKRVRKRDDIDDEYN